MKTLIALSILLAGCQHNLVLDDAFEARCDSYMENITPRSGPDQIEGWCLARGYLGLGRGTVYAGTQLRSK